MKIFIAHCWKNKHQAVLISEQLIESGHQIWMDAGLLKPGQPVQDRIDEIISEMDAIALIWGKEAAESGSVAAEIYTSSRLNKMVIPCKLDDTPIEAFPGINRLKSIDFSELETGILILDIALKHFIANYSHLNYDTRLKAMNVYLGDMDFSALIEDQKKKIQAQIAR